MADRRVFHVQSDQVRHTVAAGLRRWLDGTSWSQIRQLVKSRRVLLNGNVCTDETRRLGPNDVVKVLDQAAPREAGESDVRIEFFDDHVCVAVKPAGINTNRHDDERTARRPQHQPSLAEILPRVLRKVDPRCRAERGFPPVFPVHRLDRETAGLIVFARTRKAERHLGWQFRQHSVHRRYLAIVPGKLEERTIESILVRDRGDGRRGNAAPGEAPHHGRRAVTHVRPIETIGEYTVVECRLETGRTHQIRIHLSELGHPLCGERVYDRPLYGRPRRDTSGAPRLCLHAAELGFEHPSTGEFLRFTCPWPRDLAGFLDRLRSLPSGGPNR
ncbi:MAG: RluA family pseudouridine synthase [Planctomycetes bacterium]|nr:RluA family pseudouridine synthase [Planctomycetota bacterium]